MANQGLIQLYYGDGKGKTTAAFGLAFRCAGRGKNVVIGQFLKGNPTGELTAAQRFPEITLLRTKDVHKFVFQMNDEEKARTARDCQRLLTDCVAAAKEKNARILVLDEVIDACTLELLPLADLCAFLDGKPEELEVVITGHSLPEELARRADYVTRMAKEKHPYDRGVMARADIEF